MPGLPLRVGTRGSPLALVQTRAFLEQIMAVCPVLRGLDAFREYAIATTGDAIQNRPLSEIGGKGLFAREIHEALLDGRIDFAVHSLKDLETELPAGVVLILPEGEADPENPFASLPQGALVGSASLRRQAQLLALRPDLRVETIRGNVQTRLAKVRSGAFAGSLLALAGLKRLGLEGEAAAILAPEIMLPAACQGIVGVTLRARDAELHELLSAVEDPKARAVSRAELEAAHQRHMALFEQADTDRDGKLTRDEMRAFHGHQWQARRSQRRSEPRAPRDPALPPALGAEPVR